MEADVKSEAVELARILVAELDKDELPLFPAIVRAWEAAGNPGRRLHSSEGGAGLPFGSAEAASLVAPIALIVAKEIVVYMVTELGKAFWKETAAEIAERVRLMIHKKPSGILLDDTHAARISDIVEKAARQAKLPGVRQIKLRDAIIRQLREA